MPLQYHDGITMAPAIADEALPAGRLVKRTATGYALADAADIAVGVTRDTYAAGDTVQPFRFSVSSQVLLDGTEGALSIGEAVYQAADGKIQQLPAGAGTYRKVGIAQEAAGDGEWCEIEFNEIGATTTVV